MFEHFVSRANRCGPLYAMRESCDVLAGMAGDLPDGDYTLECHVESAAYSVRIWRETRDPVAGPLPPR